MIINEHDHYSFSQLTVVEPRSNRRARDAALEHVIVIVHQSEESSVPAVTVAPHADSIAIQERVAVQHLSAILFI